MSGRCVDVSGEIVGVYVAVLGCIGGLCMGVCIQRSFRAVRGCCGVCRGIF